MDRNEDFQRANDGYLQRALGAQAKGMPYPEDFNIPVGGGQTVKLTYKPPLTVEQVGYIRQFLDLYEVSIRTAHPPQEKP